MLTIILLSEGFRVIPEMFGENMFWTIVVAILLLALWFAFVHLPATEIERAPTTYFAKAAALPSSVLALGQTGPYFLQILMAS